MVGVFRLYDLEEDGCKIKYLGNTEKDIIDEIYFQEEIRPTIFNKIFICHLSDIYASTNKKLPIINTFILNQTNIATSEILRINTNFNVKDIIEKDDLGKKIEGYYTLEIIMNNKKKEFEINIKNFDDLIILMKDFVKTKDINDMIDQGIEKIKEDRYKRYGKFNYGITKAKYNIDEIIEREKNGENIDDILKELN